MTEKIRLTEEQKEQNNKTIAQIAELTAQIKNLAVNLNGAACKTAYDNSVSNLETKNEKYVSRAPFQVSAEEKELVTKFRAGELVIKEKKVRE
jgi:hypothetical protein